MATVVLEDLLNGNRKHSRNLSFQDLTIVSIITGGHVIFIVSALELCCLKDNPSTQINDVTTVTNNGLSEELIRCL